MQELTQRLQALSSAEDFFQFFGVPYDAHVVHVNRLHILKRFNQYLAREPGLDGLDEVGTFKLYRELLARAHADFTTTSAVQERLFKVFQQADGRAHVGVERLREALAERRAA